MDVETLKTALDRYSLRANRALGQNFLVSDEAIRAILDAAEPDGKPILEIGPGMGALTRGLVGRADRVVAVEKDARMADALRLELAACENLSVVTADFLDADVPSLMGDAPYEAVGNLPYYVTTPIAEKLLRLAPRRMTLMVQTEAAARFTAQPGDRVYGPVAVLSSLCYDTRTVLDVPPHAFYPAPEVKSRVVCLTRKSDAPTDGLSAFVRFIRRALLKRRKTLRNVLRDEAGLDNALDALSLDGGVRAETLSPETLYALWRRLSDVASDVASNQAIPKD